MAVKKTESAKAAPKARAAANGKASAKSAKAPASKRAPAKTKAAASPKKPAARSAAAKTAASKSKAKPAVRKSAVKKSVDELYGESSSLMAPAMEPGDNSKKKKIAIVTAASVLLLLLLFFGIRGIAKSASSSGAKGGVVRQNTLALAQKYLDKGQYDKAMDLLNGLLISNPNDAEADELLDKAIQLKKESDERNAAATSVVVQPGDSSYNISIDTDEITAALR